MRRPALLAAVITLAVSAVLAPQGAAAAIPSGSTWREVWFESRDGTRLRADVFLPADRSPEDRHPVILTMSPYTGRSAMNIGSGGGVSLGPVVQNGDFLAAARPFDRGYAYVQVDIRGYGGSGGCYDLGGPNEQMDAAAAVEWAASEPWSNGRVGTYGISYEGWTQVMALAHAPEGLQAAVVQSPIIDGYRTLYMNGVHYDEGWYLTPMVYAGYDLAPQTPASPTADHYVQPLSGTAGNPACYAENATMTAVPDRTIPYWRARDIIEAAGRSTVPVLWSHGFLDANTKPDNFLPVYSRLQGPKRAWFGQFNHVQPEGTGVNRRTFAAEAIAWLDHYLRDLPLPSAPPVEVEDGLGRWRGEQAWPPADAARYPMPLRAGSYDDVPGNAASGAAAGRGHWTFTQPAPYDLHIAGEPTLTVQTRVTPAGANLIGLLYDVDPSGYSTLVTRGAYRLDGTGDASFELYPQDWVVRAGHRLGLLLSGDDSSFFRPTNTGTTVAVDAASLSIPFLRWRRSANLGGGPSTALGSVPRFTVARATIDAATTPMTFPPRLEDR